MTAAKTIEILEILEESKLGQGMNETEKVIYLMPIAFELARIFERDQNSMPMKGGQIQIQN